jgi:hypothetical protein
MRRLPLLLLLLPAAVACRGTQAYSSTDLQQVRKVYRTVPPIYRAFKAAYFAGNTSLILKEYAREQKACKLVDVIDKRDTIDPNTNLFVASAGLDSLCNDIESAYTGWAIVHHYPHDKSIVPGRAQDAFVDGDTNLEKMPSQMAHPKAYPGSQ